MAKGKKLKLVQMKPKRVLLLAPPYRKGYMRNARCDFISWSGTNWYPIQLGYLGAFLQQKGCHVRLIDAQAYGMNDYDVGRILNSFMPDYVVIYAGRESFEEDLALAKEIEKIAPTKLVGPFYALKADQYRVAGIEGCLEDGVLSWIQGKVDSTRPIVGEHLTSGQMDNMPFVSDFFKRQLNPRYYRTPSEPWPFVDIMTGRGCVWGKCTFCLWPQTYKQGYTGRSIDNVIAEVAKIEREDFFQSIMIEDDTFPEPRIVEFCEKKIAGRLKIPWSCLVRADLMPRTLRLMSEANCLNIHVGYESGSDDTLRRINKGITVEEMFIFTERAKETGLKIHGDFQIGIDLTSEKIEQTIDFALQLDPDTAQFQIHIPFYLTSEAEDAAYCARGPGWDENYLRRTAREAYRRFYGRPRKWPIVAKQLLKPSILRESVKSVLGVK